MTNRGGPLVGGPMTVWQSLRHHRLLVFLAGVVCFIVAGMTGACGAHRRPASPSEEDHRLLETEPLPYVVSVVPWDSDTSKRLAKDAGAYAQSLAELLAASHAFRRSRMEAEPGSDTDFIASPTGAHCNTAIVPFWSIISLGLVPTVFDDENCDSMVLRSAKSPTAGSVEVGVQYKGRVVMGLAAIPLGVLPGWSHGSAREDTRYRERFRLEIIRQRGEIERLVGR